MKYKIKLKTVHHSLTILIRWARRGERAARCVSVSYSKSNAHSGMDDGRRVLWVRYGVPFDWYNTMYCAAAGNLRNARNYFVNETSPSVSCHTHTQARTKELGLTDTSYYWNEIILQLHHVAVTVGNIARDQLSCGGALIDPLDDKWPRRLHCLPRFCVSSSSNFRQKYLCDYEAENDREIFLGKFFICGGGLSVIARSYRCSYGID